MSWELWYNQGVPSQIYIVTVQIRLKKILDFENQNKDSYAANLINFENNIQYIQTVFSQHIKGECATFISTLNVDAPFIPPC